MDAPQITIYCILVMTLTLFIYGRWRYDVVAILALLATTLTGLVSPAEAFLGFGHPAVITVGAVLALSVGLQKAGVVESIYYLVSKAGQGVWMQLAIICLIIAVISGFINNIGALAILLPVAMESAKKCKKPPSLFLMPIAFSSLLGGMVTMIGTPPNIIVALLRQETVGAPFTMFDFTPVGLGVAVAGLLFILTVGWRLIPIRKGKVAKGELFEITDYLTELKVTNKSSCIGLKIKEFVNKVDGDVAVTGLIRKKLEISSPSINEMIEKGDLLIVEADSETLHELTHIFSLKLVTDHKKMDLFEEADDVLIAEAVVKKEASIVKKEVASLQLKKRFGVSLLALSRSGKPIKKRLNNINIQAGDVLLMRGTEDAINTALPILGCLPLQYRGLNVGEPKRLILSLLVFGIAIMIGALGLLQIQISFVLAVMTMYFLGLLRLRDIYDAIDWPIIILLGALIPVGQALETTGAATQLSEGILSLSGGYHPAIILTIVLVGTMFLSDLVNNATAAILMVPIAARLAAGLGVSPDPFFMGVAIGASCPFLTPIGHQCNTIILGPGGYRFGDYWRVGLPLEVVIAATAIPLIMFFWPF